MVASGILEAIYALGVRGWDGVPLHVFGAVLGIPVGLIGVLAKVQLPQQTRGRAILDAGLRGTDAANIFGPVTSDLRVIIYSGFADISGSEMSMFTHSCQRVGGVAPTDRGGLRAHAAYGCDGNRCDRAGSPDSLPTPEHY